VIRSQQSTIYNKRLELPGGCCPFLISRY